MHQALGRTVPPLMITWALDAVAATAITAAAAVVTGDHAIPEEVIPAADVTGVTPGGGLVPVTHHDHGPLDNITITHDPAEGIDPTTEVGLDPREEAPVVDPVLQIANIPGMFHSLLMRNDVEQVGASIPSHKLITDRVAKISYVVVRLSLL